MASSQSLSMRSIAFSLDQTANTAKPQIKIREYYYSQYQNLYSSEPQNRFIMGLFWRFLCSFINKQFSA